MRAHTRRRLFLVLSLLAVVITFVTLRHLANLLPVDEVIDYHGKDLLLEDGEMISRNRQNKHVKQPTLAAQQQRYLLNSSGCQIPDMQAFSSSAKQHHKPPAPLQCSRRLRKYRVTRAAAPVVKKMKSDDSVVLGFPPHGLQCCYRHIKRHTHKDNGYKVSEQCQPMERLIATEDARNSDPDFPAEFVHIGCHKPGSDEWSDDFKDVHAFVPLKDDVEWRCEHAPKEEDQLSVVLLGVDSVSRLNMERHLPKTLSLLTSPPLNSIPLLGYNKVADNTFPNLMPVLMGSSVDEVGEACEWPGKDNWNNNFDNCPLIWNDYAFSGFRTMYAEECPHLSTFNFQKGGFGDQPTDYYLRPLLQAAADEIGHTRADNCLLCMGTRTSVDLLLQYTTQFLHRFSSTLRHFAFVWATSLTHDGLNMAALADKPFHDTIRRTLDHGDLDNTALFFISDHGVRTGEFRLTPQGRMEERLPFLSVSLPAWFRARYATAVRNLETNARARLTTPFDVHETLRDLLAPAKLISDDAIKSRMLKLQTSKSKVRGISLFLEIPEDRTCDDAEIPRHWCTCLNYQPLPLDDPGLLEAAQALVLHINTRFLAAHKQCRNLTLAKIVEARLGVPGKNDNATVIAGIKDYALTIQTNPGGALLEGAVRGYTHRGRKNINKIRFEVADSISRLNRYGSQSACVEDWVVKLYCYCDEQEEEEEK